MVHSARVKFALIFCSLYTKSLFSKHQSTLGSSHLCFKSCTLEKNNSKANVFRKRFVRVWGCFFSFLQLVSKGGITTVQEGRDRCINVYIHNLSPKACMPLGKRKIPEHLRSLCGKCCRMWCPFHLCSPEHTLWKHEQRVTAYTTKINIPV